MKKIVKIIIPIILILTIIVFLVVLLSSNKNKDKIELKQTEFVYELGEEVSADVSDYLKDADTTKNIKDYSLLSDSLMVKEKKFMKGDLTFLPVGEYKLNITYRKEKKHFLVKVLDTIAPEFIVTQEVIEIEENVENIDLTTFFEAKDYSKIKLSIDGDYDLSKVGEYNLKIIAEDESNNKAEKEFILKVNQKIVPKVEENLSNNNNGNNNNKQSPNVIPKNPTPSVPNQSFSGYKKELADSYVRQINDYRKANGLSELPVTSEAQSEADRRSKELISYYSHDGVGYGFGEIIGNGSIGSDFITAWKNSPPHNATMLREGSVAIAASVYEYNNYWYAVVSFRMNY